MKYCILLLASFFISAAPLHSFCSPIRPMASKLILKKGEISFVKGYFLPHDGTNVHLAKFKVLQSSNSGYTAGLVYPVYEYGPFGSECEIYEIGSSPLEKEFCGSNNLRYLLVYSNLGDSNRLVSPIFHSEGLIVDELEDKISDPYHERTSLSSFEDFIKGTGGVPKWTVIED